MAERFQFSGMGISVEGEKHILEDLVDFVRRADQEGVEPSNAIGDLICSIEVAFELNGMSRDVNEDPAVDPATANRFDRIRAFKGNQEIIEDAKARKHLDETMVLVEQIRALKPRIDVLLETGNACLENGIEIDAYRGSFYRDLDSYERGTFVTNGISHKVGFASARKSEPLTMLGIDNGGACGPYDFRTDGERVFFVHEDDVTRVVPATQKKGDLERFLRDFDKFESAFYSYVDKTLDKQRASLDAAIGAADAYRSNTAGQAKSAPVRENDAR